MILTFGLKYGLFESAKNINTSDSETKHYQIYFLEYNAVPISLDEQKPKGWTFVHLLITKLVNMSLNLN